VENDIAAVGTDNYQRAWLNRHSPGIGGRAATFDGRLMELLSIAFFGNGLLFFSNISTTIQNDRSEVENLFPPPARSPFRQLIPMTKRRLYWSAQATPAEKPRQ